MRAFFPSTSVLLAAAAFAAAFTLVSCGPAGDQAPQPGTSAFAWAQAKNYFQKSNFVEASNQLDRLTGKDGEFRDRAEALQTVIALGLARGEMEWADLLDEGAIPARTKALEFRRAASAARSAAHQMVMRAAEIEHKSLDRLLKSELQLPFALPALSADLPVEAARVKKGVVLQQSEQDVARQRMEQRGVLQAFGIFTGSGADVAKTTSALAAGDFKMKPATYAAGVAREFVELTAVYAPKKLDNSGQVKLLCDMAAKALEAAPADEKKALTKRIDEIRKKLKK